MAAGIRSGRRAPAVRSPAEAPIARRQRVAILERSTLHDVDESRAVETLARRTPHAENCRCAGAVNQ